MRWEEDLAEFCRSIGCSCFLDEPMSRHTTFRIGGPAEVFVLPRNRLQAAKIIRLAGEMEKKVTIVGKGSNLLVCDDGIKGITLKLDEESARPELVGEAQVRCPAGASLATLCSFALKHGLSGLEFAWGIPGSVGGAVYMNAGAYGGEIKDVLSRVEYLDSSGGRHEAKTEQLQMGYRKSWFSLRGGQFITNTLFALQKDSPEEIRRRMEEHMRSRREKQPLEYPSAGSTFKRPPGAYASELIDQCGLRGRQIGGAMVSKKHAGFIINYDAASCEDVVNLIEEVKKVVKINTGFTLEPEVKLLGGGKEGIWNL